MARKRKTEGETNGAPEVSAESITKAEAVRRALAAGHATPSRGVPFIKEHFGIDIGPQHFSALKSQLKGRKGEGGQKGSREAVAGKQTQARPSGGKRGGQADVIAALEAIKPLVAALGAERVKRLVDVLGD